MENLTDLSFVIPVYNEESSLAELSRRIEQTVKENSLGSIEILFIDDGSTDASWTVIKDLSRGSPVIHGIRFRRNFGKAAAISSGFAEARGDIVITMDADLQDIPEEIPNMVSKLNEGYDLVSGWKRERHDPMEKRLPSKVFNAITGTLTGLQLHDFNCGFKAYRRSVTETVKVYGELHRFIPALAHAEGFRVAELAVRHQAREYGKSKYGFGRYFKGCLDLLTVVSTTRFLRRPLHFFGGAGFVLGFIGLFILGVLSAMKLFLGIPIAGRPMFFLGILSVLASLQLLSIGLLAELINRHQGEKLSQQVHERTGFADIN